jgi:predicted Ser/Thr protein kinase
MSQGTGDPPEPTVFAPPPAPQSGSQPGPQPTAVGPTSAPPPGAPAPGASYATRIGPGAILNGIYVVRRFIGRGGMGEVFEGANLQTDERVAIKVMLPHMAADPNFQNIFIGEARTLTKLSHPALMQYRLLAQEPTLGVIYMVMEFIDGPSLSDAMHLLKGDEAQIRVLLRRLAEGLRSAHDVGVYHRDISPDNVILLQDRIDRAKIIDFGIAKDLTRSGGTIVGDAFAGKLGYAAPEQFGDFDREIGPWTDIYSLGLVIWATAAGHEIDMGATIVDALNKRRIVHDFSDAPAGLRPVLEGMLKADPRERFRSMDAVLAALEAPATPAAVDRPTAASPGATVWAPPPSRAASTQAPPATARAPRPAASAKRPMGLLVPGIAGGVVFVAVAVGAILFLSQGKHSPSSTSTNVAGAAGPVAASGATSTAAARQATAAVLPTVPCSWLDVADVSADPGGAVIRLSGVQSSSAAGAVRTALQGRSIPVARIDDDEPDVASVDQAVCQPLEAFRSMRTAGAAPRLTTSGHQYTMSMQQDGKTAALAVINFDVNGAKEFALFGIEPSGEVTPVIPDREALKADVKQGAVTDLGSDRYQLPIETDHKGLSMLVLVTGDAKVGGATPTQKLGGSAAADWARQAGKAGWTADLAWYETS